jgi:hypothetical protein
LDRKGVIRKDCGEREGLLRPDNIHRSKLEEYARVSRVEHFYWQSHKFNYFTRNAKPNIPIARLIVVITS